MAADRPPTPVEELVGLLVAAAVGVQTWMLIQEATQGDAGRAVRRWWAAVGAAARPPIDRALTWLDAAQLTERMYADEVVPHLEAHSGQ